MSGEAEGKGTNFVGTLRSLRELRGLAVHDKVIAETPGPGGEALRLGKIVPVGWYPVSWYLALHDTIQRVTGDGVSITRQLAAITTKNDFTGLHRLVVKMLSPATAARHTHRLLQLYWRGGTAEVIESRDDRVRVRFKGWRGFDVAVWEDLAGSIDAILIVVGAPAPRARVVAMAADRSEAEIEARFS